MASKRQRKKKQAKKNIQLLQSVGIKDKKRLKELKNKPKETQKIYKKESHRIERNEEANRRSDFMRNVLGLPMTKENQSKRYWGKKRWEEWKNEQLAIQEKKRKKEERERKKRERKLKDDNDLYLLLFWKEKTEGFADESIIEDYKHEYKYMDNEYLIKSIHGFLTAKLPSLIGAYNIQVVRGSERKNTISFMKGYDTGAMADWNNWIPVYEGKTDLRRYHELLLAIHTIVRLLYDNEEKANFIGDLIEKYLPQVNKKTAARLAKDLHYRRGGF